MTTPGCATPALWRARSARVAVLRGGLWHFGPRDRGHPPLAADLCAGPRPDGAPSSASRRSPPRVSARTPRRPSTSASCTSSTTSRASPTARRVASCSTARTWPSSSAPAATRRSPRSTASRSTAWSSCTSPAPPCATAPGSRGSTTTTPPAARRHRAIFRTWRRARITSSVGYEASATPSTTCCRFARILTALSLTRCAALVKPLHDDGFVRRCRRSRATLGRSACRRRARAAPAGDRRAFRTDPLAGVGCGAAGLGSHVSTTLFLGRPVCAAIKAFSLRFFPRGVATRAPLRRLGISSPRTRSRRRRHARVVRLETTTGAPPRSPRAPTDGTGLAPVCRGRFAAAC